MNKAQPAVIQMLAIRNKCWMCKHKFKAPVLLPVKTPEWDKLQPNINTEVLFHLSDTHGQDPATVRGWIIGLVYGLELTEVGIKGVQHD